MTTVTPNNIHIEDSSLMPKGVFDAELRRLRVYHTDDCLVLQHRGDCSLKLEWATHKACYCMHIARSRTKDVDLDWPQPWWLQLAYAVVGALVWMFV